MTRFNLGNENEKENKIKNDLRTDGKTIQLRYILDVFNLEENYEGIWKSYLKK